MIAYDLSNLEKLLYSKGILTNLPQLPSADKATISPDERVLGALDIIRHLLQNKHFYQMPFWRYTEEAAANVCFVGTWYKCLRTLLSIVSQPWWERVWVIQEAVLSPNALLNIGRHQVLLSCFFPAVKNYHAHNRTCCRIWTGLWHGTCDEIYMSIVSKMSVLMWLGKVINDYATNRLTPIGIALLSSRRKASDPRDHFYAITGLMKNPHNGAPLGPTPDYRLDPGQLFREQTLSLMLQSDSIDLLNHAIGIDAPNTLSLPSWVCDWSRFVGVGWTWTLYNASNGHKHRFQPAAEGTFITVGAMVGVVSKLGNFMDHLDANDIAIKIEQWQHLAETGKTFDIRTVLRATLRDTVVSGEGERRRLTSGDIAQVEQWWWQWIIRMKRHPGQLESPESWSIACNFVRSMRSGRVFVTREGQFGFGPHTLCVGDRIFIVRGPKVPLVFRPLEDDSLAISSSRPCRDYSYVGRCYLHGFMDGEAVTPETDWQTLRLH